MGEVRFYRSHDDWLALAERLKQTACPHCKVVGTLNRRALYRFCIENGLLHPDRIGRVAPGSCLPGAPADPDVPD